jgi:hypothetical protein
LPGYNKIKFSQHWDKLNDAKFTTIRSWNAAKEEYYISKIGEKYTGYISVGSFDRKCEKCMEK